MKKLLFCLAALPIVSSSIFAATGTHEIEATDPTNKIRFEVVD